MHTVLTPIFHPKRFTAKAATNIVRFAVLSALFFGMAATANAAGSGYFSLFGDVSETDDTSCGVGKSRFSFVTREYNTESPVSVANITVRTVGGAAPQTVSGDSNFWLTNTICVEVATQAIDIKVDDGEPPATFQTFSGSYTIKNPLNWTGRRITSHVHLRRLGDGTSVSHGASPEDKWYQTQPPFDVVVDSIPVPVVHSADGVHGIRLFTTPPSTFWAYTSVFDLGGDVGEGTYTVTLPPSSLTEGKQSWGFYVGLDGGSPDPISGWSGTRQFGLDMTAPSPVTVTRSVTTVSETSTFTVTGRATDPLSGLAWIGVYFDGTLVKECDFAVGLTQGPTSQQSCTSESIGPFPYGSTHAHEVRARDKAGNESTNTSSFSVSCTKDSQGAGSNPYQFQGCFYQYWEGTKQGDAPPGALLSPVVPLVAVALDYDWSANPPPLYVFNAASPDWYINYYFTTSWVGTFTFPAGSYRFYSDIDSSAYQCLYFWKNGSWEQQFPSCYVYGSRDVVRFFPSETTVTIKLLVIPTKYQSPKRITFGWDQNILCDEQAFGINRFLGCAYNGTNLNYTQNVLRATTAPGPQLSDPVPLRAVALNNRWGYTSPDALVNNDYFFTRYKAIFNMPKAAVYRFIVGFDTGANVYFGSGFDLNGNLLNSQLVSENWYNQSDSLESNPGGVSLGNNGLNMYMLGGGTDTVYQYSLGTAWAAASADTAEYAAKAVAMEDTNPTGFFFKPDGTMMYMVGTGSTTKKVSQYLLSPAWDVTTATLVATAGIYQETSPTGVFIGNNGLAMYVIGTQYDTVHKYTLSTAWNVATAVYANSFKSVSSQEYLPQDVFFSTDGKKMYIIGTAYDNIREYTLKTAWTFDATPSNDPLTASFSVGTQETAPTGMYFDPTGTKLYVVGTNNDTVYQYTLTTAWSVSTASYDSSSLAVGGSGLDMFLKSLPMGPLAVEIRHYENYNNALLSFAWSEKGGPVIYCDPALSGINQFLGCVYNGTDFTKRVSVPQDDVALVIGPDVTDGAGDPVGSVKTGVTAYSYNWGDSSPAPAKVGVDSWSMEMSGNFMFPQGTYDFTANIACCNSFMYVYFDEVQVAYLTSGSNTFSYDFTNPLGENVAIKIRYANVSGAAQVGFSWVRATTGIGVSLLAPLGTYTMFPGKEGPAADLKSYTWSNGDVSGSAPQDSYFPTIYNLTGLYITGSGYVHCNACSTGTYSTYIDIHDPLTDQWSTVWSREGVDNATFVYFSGVSATFPEQDVNAVRIRFSPAISNIHTHNLSGTKFSFLPSALPGFILRVDSESGFAGTVSVDIPTPPPGIIKTGTWPKTCIVAAYDYCLLEGLSVRTTDVGSLTEIYKTYNIPIVADAGMLSTQTVGTVVTRGYDISVSPSNIPQFPLESSLTYTISSLSRNSYNGNITVDYSVNPPTSSITMSPTSIAMAPSSGDGNAISKIKKVLENLALAVNWWSTNSANVTVNTTAATPEQEYAITMRARASSPEGPLERVVSRKFIITKTPSIEAVPTDPDLTGQTLSWTGTAVAGNTFLFSAYAKNLSSTIPAGAMTARFCIDNPLCITDNTGSLGNVAVPGLAALGAYEVTSSWIATGGTHVVYFCVDVGVANGVVPETNESNNCIFSASFNVTNLSVGFTSPSTALPLNTGAVQNTSVTIPYNSLLSFRYDSVDAVSCDYYDTTDTLIPPVLIWLGGPPSSTWPGAGPYTGSFTRQAICTDANGNRSRPANLLVTVLPPPLILTLSANPRALMDGNSASTTLSSPVGGSATGFIDYYYWWNCANASADVSILNANGAGACGRLANPQLGSCRFNGSGVICSQMNLGNPWTSPNKVSNPTGGTNPYKSAGIYTAKVIVNRGGYAAQATTTVDVSTIPPQLQVFPLVLDYNDVVLNESRDLQVTVTNVGRGVLTGSLTFPTVPAGPFTCSPASPNPCSSFGVGLLNNESMSYLIRFTPTVLGPNQQRQVPVPSNGGNATIGLIGNSVNALVSAGLDFGNVIVNRTKDLTFTLHNNSSIVDIGSGTLDFPVPFTCVSSSVGGAGVCSYNLPPDATNTFVIRFSPLVVTPYSENATLSGSPSYTFPFVGNGVSGTIKFQDQ
ncbi:MAG: hypothetical protein A2762_06040 [Candidatus Lloydbacteria bacterium RIFCSPHIGHO2_01_FULL_54_11]|nr:MAG: hypothetical protein A2762_06040 [Candidatus Lloydbacteria bacterium RIFCSPHIGHO2_01_FULL_54_11]